MWKDYNKLNHPAIIIITGNRGSGKSATAHTILETYHEKGIQTYYIAPKTIQQKHLCPDWIKYSERRLHDNAVTLIDDAQLIIHAKEYWKSVDLHKIITLTRHGDRSVIFTTQQTRSITKDVFAEVDTIIVKEPSLVAQYTERDIMKAICKDATTEYKKLGDDTDHRQYSYIVSNKPPYMGMCGPTELPSYWSEELSKW